MKVYPTFCDGHYQGYMPIKSINSLKEEAYKLSAEKQKTENADHMIYGYTSYRENGEIDTVHLYSGIAKNDSEFDEVSKIPNAMIYAIHKKK